MKLKPVLRAAAGGLIVATTIGLSATAAMASPANSGGGVMANFDGGQIDLADGWGSAHYCWTDGTTTDCYTTAAELAAGAPDAAAAPAGTVPGDCLAATDLFDQTSFNGDELQVFETGSWVNLADYDFTDVQSFAIGACDTILNSEADGDGSNYPTSETTPGSVAPVLDSGWAGNILSLNLEPSS